MKKNMKLIWEAIKRTAALTATKVAGVMASGAVMDVETWKTAAMAGLVATLDVWSEIGEAYYKDGKLTKAEVDEAFSNEE